MTLRPAEEARASLEAAAPGTLSTAEPRHLEEPRGRWRAASGLLARPRSTAEVAALVRTCARERVGIVPLGGGTGLVGGQVAEGCLILSFERMTAIREISRTEDLLICEAGAILSDVQAAAEAEGRLFPLSLASKGSARIGGLLAANAGGVNVLRWGNMRDLAVGVEAVLPDGTVLGGPGRLRKDNAGYDIRHLLIGAEGTLGIVTAASLRLVPPPASVATAWIAVPSPEAALKLLGIARDRAGEGVSAFELISGVGLGFLAEHLPDLRQPLAPAPDWSVLIELGLPSAAEDALAGIYEAAAEAGLAGEAVLAASEAQRAALWDVRESIPLGNRAVGALASHDISVPLGMVPEMIAEGVRRLEGRGVRLNAFGHLGDGNLHYNLFPARGRARGDYDAEALTGIVHGLVRELGGSIAAEHGVGRLKAAELAATGDPGKLAAMRAVKAALDPAGIMNPGAVLPRRAEPPGRGRPA
ncbi:FAD/FMN-containing dehydrogenase [Hasllibacter halocynthiae]|uniref:FAD/FMN-containing dehydrogenase n=1 Tax=Hasllibacter halocynthiae TaxID=595589 RepID=A0A2T0X9H8_9RHOB|nr:FAD-binding oxidoreductase [Hasllibacter halocynthiae]PRY95600.1 FAD/FMN-containing dehydrogenase [Hasllibacter halocynthiae]